MATGREGWYFDICGSFGALCDNGTAGYRRQRVRAKATRTPDPALKEGEIRRSQPWFDRSVHAACAALLLIMMHIRPASSEVPDGTWMFADRVALQVFECEGLVCGRIVWLVRPRTPDGRPDVDRFNPDPNLRQRPLCGLTIIWGLQPDAPGHWSNGSLYDPQDGNTYDLTAEMTAPDRISARVYRGLPLLGRTEILVRDPQLSFDGRC